MNTTTLSPERAAKRAKERADLNHMGEAVTRFLAIPAVAANYRGDRSGLIIVLLQVQSKHPEVCWETLAGFPEEDLTHDILGMLEHATPGNGTLRNLFLPRCWRSGRA